MNHMTIDASDFSAIVTVAKSRRLLRGHSRSSSARTMGISANLLARFEMVDCNGISYQSIRKIMIAMNLSHYIQGIPHEKPSHIDAACLIKSSRQKKSLTLRELSDISGVPFSTIFDIENSTAYSAPTYLNVIRLLNTLGHQSCVIQTDEDPHDQDEQAIKNIRKVSGHAMYSSPYPM